MACQSLSQIAAAKEDQITKTKKNHPIDLLARHKIFRKATAKYTDGQEYIRG